MLVLTTMFINVSNNLPQTSYVKMVDVWLIFNLLLPFIEVLVHTYMDTLRYLVFLSDPSGTDLHLVFSFSFFSSFSHLALLLLSPTSTCPRPPNPYIF